MQTNEILEALDRQIAQLQQARALLTNQASQLQTGKRRGRPKSSDSKMAKSVPAAANTAKRTMSAEGKARIAAKKSAKKTARVKSAPVVKTSATEAVAAGS
jgi:hypothetical protein